MPADTKAPSSSAAAASPAAASAPGGPPSGSSKPAAPPSQLLRLNAIQQSSLLRDYSVTVHLQQLHSIPGVEMAGTKLFVESFLADAWQTKDPVERLLLEQLLLVSHRLGLLHRAAAGAETLEASRILNAAAARLMAEMRRMALAVKKYREPATTRSFTVVKMRNEATGAAGEQMNYSDEPIGRVAQAPEASYSRRIELGDTSDDTGHDQGPQPPPRRRRTDQRTLAAAVVG